MVRLTPQKVLTKVGLMVVAGALLLLVPWVAWVLPARVDVLLPVAMVLVSLAIFIMLAVDLVRWFSNRPRARAVGRHRLGLCVKCGYDVRSCGERCAECGWPLEQASEEEKRKAAASIS